MDNADSQMLANIEFFAQNIAKNAIFERFLRKASPSIEQNNQTLNRITDYLQATDTHKAKDISHRTKYVI